jgi:hypothetical protein
VLAQENGVTDVRGSLRSVYGLFGLGVAFLTALSFLGALVGLARHRLPQNRWRRGLRFLTPGLGLGLVINFTLSATRVFVPEIGRWLAITFTCAVLFFVLGYLTPTPDLVEDDLEEAPPTQMIEEITVVAVSGRPGRPALPAYEQAPADGTPYPEVGPALVDPEDRPGWAAPVRVAPQVPMAWPFPVAPPVPVATPVAGAWPAPGEAAPLEPAPPFSGEPAAPATVAVMAPADPRATLPVGFSPADLGPATHPPTSPTPEDRTV